MKHDYVVLHFLNICIKYKIFIETKFYYFSDVIIAVLWNLYNYYAQFISNVETKIKNLRSPIEKKLKDFVKIARWNDINYWAVKETVEKTHKILHKYIKEFEVQMEIDFLNIKLNTYFIYSGYFETTCYGLFSQLKHI